MRLDFVDVQKECLHQLPAAETVGNMMSRQVFEDQFIKKLRRLRGGQRGGFQGEGSPEGSSIRSTGNERREHR